MRCTGGWWLVAVLLLSGGYRQVRYRSSEVVFGLSTEQFKIRMSGPLLQLQLAF